MVATHGKNIKIFAGNSHRKLAKDIAARLNLPLGNSEAKTFSDGEICVNINETVRGSDVFVLQSTSFPVNDHIMELLIMIDAFKRASAASEVASSCTPMKPEFKPESPPASNGGRPRL